MERKRFFIKTLSLLPSSLSLPEWFVVYFFLILILSFVSFAKISSWRAQSFLSEMGLPEMLQIEVKGEVVRSGTYEVEKGSSCRELLQKISLKRFADLSHIDLDAEVPPLLIIPRLQEIRVFVEGDYIELQEFLLPAGTRLSELKSKISLDKRSDSSVFHSRRMLFDQERIWVGKRK